MHQRQSQPLWASSSQLPDGLRVRRVLVVVRKWEIRAVYGKRGCNARLALGTVQGNHSISPAGIQALCTEEQLIATCVEFCGGFRLRHMAPIHRDTIVRDDSSGSLSSGGVCNVHNSTATTLAERWSIRNAATLNSSRRIVATFSVFVGFWNCLEFGSLRPKPMSASSFARG